MTVSRHALVLAALGSAVALATPSALGQDALRERKQQVDSRISALQTKIASGKEKEGVLSSEIATASADIESLQGDITGLTALLGRLESDLARHRSRLARLEDRHREQTRQLRRVTRDHGRAQDRLEERLIELYETDQADALEIILQVQSLGALIEQVDFMNEVGRQDRRIVSELKRLDAAIREARKRTARSKKQVEEATAVLAEKTEEARAARAELIAREEALAAARADKRALLVGVRGERHEAEEDLDALEAASVELGSRIQAAAAAAAAEESSSAGGSSSEGGASGAGSGGGGSSDSTPSSSGLIWPVSGSVTSGFGTRWGRLHAGIDIAAPTGTPVRAAAAGRVIIAGWMGGYGNIIVIQHSGGLSTAYAHLSAIWVGGGSVSQGQNIGAVGCTGSCTGSHLHFEVRVNGTPVNPLAYL